MLLVVLVVGVVIGYWLPHSSRPSESRPSPPNQPVAAGGSSSPPATAPSDASPAPANSNSAPPPSSSPVKAESAGNTVAVPQSSQSPQVVAEEDAYSRFSKEYQKGADCKRLFQIRLEIIQGVNASQREQLKAIGLKLGAAGCFYNTSTRRRVPSREPGGFSVQDYWIYRTVIDTPYSVPLDEACRRAGAPYGFSGAEAKRIVDAVDMWLRLYNGRGTADSEVRFASDWSGESGRNPRW